MHYRTLSLDEFCIIGISVRTTNQNGQSEKDIGELWGKFMGGNIMDLIPQKISPDVYCVYTDYESDLNGAYTTILGCKVKALENIPEGFVGITIPKSTYNVFTSVGKLPESVVNTWVHIWQSDYNRAYKADFEVYGEKAQDMQNAEVETYLSVKD